MKRWTLVSLLAPFVSFASPALARDRIADVREELADALDAARDAGGKCERALKDVLVEARKELRGEPTARTLKRLIRDLKGAENDAEERCDKGVAKSVRRVRRTLEELRDEASDDGHGRDESSDADRDGRSGAEDDASGAEAPTQRSVPMQSWTRDCVATWYMLRLGEASGAPRDALALLEVISAAGCNSDAVGEIRYPNGSMARYANGEWRYPNGKSAVFPDAEMRYYDGRSAMLANGEWRYPNGKTACLANGEWYYPNGSTAGNWQVVKAWACTKLGDAPCNDLSVDFDSDLVEWRKGALVMMAYRAGLGQ